MEKTMKKFLLPFVIICFAYSGCSSDDIINTAPSEDDTPSTSDGTSTSSGNPPKTDEENNPQIPEDPQNPLEQPDPKTCDPDCTAPRVCIEGACILKCDDGLTECGDQCLNLAELNLESCDTCLAGFCNNDDALSNGCEVNAMTDDVNNCGGCGITCNEDQTCQSGNCTDLCPEGETLCGETCLNLTELHLASCDACADAYCDADGNLANGCEIDALAGDLNHCGSCGHTCEAGDTCEQGQCLHRYYVMLSPTPVSDENGKKLGELKQFTKVKVVEKGDTKYRIVHESFEGQSTWITAEDLMDAGDQYPNRKAIDFAEIYLYSDDAKLCTFDFKTHDPILPYLANVYGDYNNHCANFVTSVLQNVGLISKHENGAKSLQNYCKNGNDGYRQLENRADGKAGDVWGLNGHVELVIGYHQKSKKLLLIGSNNASKGIYSIAHNTYGCNGGENPGKKNACTDGKKDCSSNQRVTYSFTHNDGNVFSSQQ